MESALNGTINEEYIYLNGERVARVDRPSGTVNYYFSDNVGSASSTIITRMEDWSRASEAIRTITNSPARSGIRSRTWTILGRGITRPALVDS
jgi:hypothetical protein